jgi:hypothetical protein
MTHRKIASGFPWRRGLLTLAVVVAGLSFAGPASAATVSAGGPYTGAEGQPVRITGSVTGATSWTWSATRAPGGEQDGATCVFADPSALSTDVRCNDDGTFDLRLTASDGTVSTARLTLSNLAPVLTSVVPVTGDAAGVHSVVTLSATYRDGDPIDSHRYVINWGDGTTSRAATRLRLDGTGAFSGSHSYTRPGNRTVTVSVFDSHGLSDTASLPLQVVGGSRCATVNGAGRLPRSRHSRFALSARCGTPHSVGAVRLRVPGRGRYVSTHLTLLRGRGHAATLAGNGRWRAAGQRRAHSGYRYVITVQDRRRDRMRVTVVSPAGVRVLQMRGRIAGGHITVRS